VAADFTGSAQDAGADRVADGNRQPEANAEDLQQPAP
jgi:hypothetical protein